MVVERNAETETADANNRIHIHTNLEAMAQCGENVAVSVVKFKIRDGPVAASQRSGWGTFSKRDHRFN
jgi:hypothetical protein